MPWHTARGLGSYGERMAARYLTDRGLDVLDQNWRCDLGEIDIVARDGGCLVVCEVKTRRSTTFGQPIEAVDHRKLARLRRHGLQVRAVRQLAIARRQPARAGFLDDRLGRGRALGRCVAKLRAPDPLGRHACLVR